MFEPKNEQGVIAVFCANLHLSGWEVLEIRADFPDALLCRNGVEWKTEFEYKSRNFISHSHDFRECELIVCWENDFPECPIPVLALSNPDWAAFEIKKGNPLLNEIEYWRNRAIIAERKLARYQQKKTGTPLDEIDTDALLEFYSQNPASSLRKTGAQFGVSHTQISKILRRLESEGKVSVNGVVKVL